MAIHIGILQCDKISPEHSAHYSDYPEMFKKMFDAINIKTTFSIYSCLANEFPKNIEDVDAWIITGSRHACYENLDWMNKLEDFIRLLYINQAPCAGICFGHQIMARAMGGVVKKSTKGWGLGITTVDVFQQKSWTAPFQKALNIPVNHEDQITRLPDNAEIIAGNDFCPYFMLYYSPCFTSIQGHPEFSVEYTKTLMEKQKDCLDKTTFNKTEATFLKSCDSVLFTRWLTTFFNQTISKK